MATGHCILAEDDAIKTTILGADVLATFEAEIRKQSHYVEKDPFVHCKIVFRLLTLVLSRLCMFFF